MKKGFKVALVVPALLLCSCDQKCTKAEFDIAVSEIQYKEPVDFTVDAKIKNKSGTKTYTFKMSEISENSGRPIEENIINFICGHTIDKENVYASAKYYLGETLQIKYKGEEGVATIFGLLTALFKSNKNLIEFDKNGNMIHYKGSYDYGKANMNVKYVY